MKKLILLTVMTFVSVLGIACAQAAEVVDVEQPVVHYPVFEGNDWQQGFVPHADNITAVSI